MDFITQREPLLAELGLFSGVVEVRPTDPMSEFANISFRPEGDGCELTASSGEIGLRSRIAAQVKGQGLLNAPVGLLAAWLKEGRHENVSFTQTEDTWVRVRCGGNKTRIPVRVGEPPRLESPPGEPACSVTGEILATLIRTGSYGMPGAADATVSTAGAQIEVQGSSVRIVSSDHSRLAWASADWREGADEGADAEEVAEPPAKQAFGLNRKTLMQLGQLARAGGERPAMRFFEGGNHLFFEFGERLLVCSKLADRLPDYEHVIPRDCAVRVKVNRSALLAAVQAAMPFATGDFSRARLDIGDDAMNIHVLSVRGEAQGSVEVVESAGTPLALHINLVHLRDFGKVVDAEEVTLGCDSPDTAFLLSPVDGDSAVRHFCVGMPLAAA